MKLTGRIFFNTGDYKCLELDHGVASLNLFIKDSERKLVVEIVYEDDTKKCKQYCVDYNFPDEWHKVIDDACDKLHISDREYVHSLFPLSPLP